MELIFGHDEAVARWADKFFEGGVGKFDWAIGIIDDEGRLKGALVGQERNPWTVEVSICSGGAITSKVARWFFTWFFWRYARMEVTTTRDNGTVKRNARKWGFVFETGMPAYYGNGRDGLRFRMLRSDCRWLRENRHGLQTKSAEAA